MLCARGRWPQRRSLSRPPTRSQECHLMPEPTAGKRSVIRPTRYCRFHQGVVDCLFAMFHPTLASSGLSRERRRAQASSSDRIELEARNQTSAFCFSLQLLYIYKRCTYICIPHALGCSPNGVVERRCRGDYCPSSCVADGIWEAEIETEAVINVADTKLRPPSPREPVEMRD